MSPKFGARVTAASIGLLTVVALGLTGCTGSDADAGSAALSTMPAETSDQISGAVAGALGASRSTEAVIGVWAPWSGDLVQAYATEGDPQANADSVIRGAQASQPVVCALLLAMVEDGQVTLDREVSKDLTRQVGIDGITYRQLCDGTSGLADFKGPFADIFVNNPTRPWPIRELLAQGIATSPLSWPGLDVHVSDTDALMLGRALSVRSGTDLSELLAQYVYEPAGMKHSSLPGTEDVTLSGNHLEGISFPSAGGAPVCDVEPAAVEKISPSMLSGAGATVTTVTDLKNFYASYLGGDFESEKTTGVTTEVRPTKNPGRDAGGNPASEVTGSPSNWGFGVEQVGPLWGRSGSMPGSATAAFHDPASGFTVVVALNNAGSGQSVARALAFQIAAIVAAGQPGELEVPWTAEDRAAQIAEAAICPVPVEAPAEEAPAE